MLYHVQVVKQLLFGTGGEGGGVCGIGSYLFVEILPPKVERHIHQTDRHLHLYDLSRFTLLAKVSPLKIE